MVDNGVVTTAADGLGATIRLWRDRLSPESVGLSAGRSRRAAGLRREDLADLAGISVDYVVRLEQGRATTPSVQVVSSLARALQLTPPERDHLYRLAGHIAPTTGTVSDHIPPGVRRVVGRLDDGAVAVFAADWQLLWWNRRWAALVGDPSTVSPSKRNFARDCFPVGADTPGMSAWPVTPSGGDGSVRAAVVSDLRRATGRFPDDVRLKALIEQLRAGSPDFEALWSVGAVGSHREDHKVVHHPTVGPITVDCDVLTDGDAELKIVIMTAAPGSEDQTKLRLATVVGGIATTEFA